MADVVSGKAIALIALEGGRIVGTIDCTVQPATADIGEQDNGRLGVKMQAQNAHQRRQLPLRPQVFLKNLFVLPEQRRRGIARELVRAAEAFARREGAGTVGLEVARKNGAAGELYLSCGFEEVDTLGAVEGGLGGALLKSLGMGKRYMVKAV